MSQTAIEWATHVWNPFTGCDRVSPGCAHCYAADVALANQRKERGRAAKAEREGKPVPRMRYQHDGHRKTSGPGFGFTVHQDKLDRPPSFPAGARVFVNSMSDVFHEDAPELAIAQLFGRCAERPTVDFLILTKRPERMTALLNHPEFVRTSLRASGQVGHDWPLPNVWLGVTIENRRFVGRADILRDTPAAVRFVSAEPLLGPLIYDGIQGTPRDIAHRHPSVTRCWYDSHDGPELSLWGIDWVIAGGESGAKHRRFNPQWARDLRDACDPWYFDGREGRTAYFFKQHGGRTPKSGGRELDGRTWDEMPQVSR